jgi:hypothetical protein
MNTSTSSRTLKQKAYQQFKEFLLIALYLWFVLPGIAKSPFSKASPICVAVPLFAKQEAEPGPTGGQELVASKFVYAGSDLA